FHFISDVDVRTLADVWSNIDPERTVFIVSSKSFTTVETLANANSCREWLTQKLPAGCASSIAASHFVAVTARAEKAEAWGIPADNIFPIWDWVGGRYSIWSAIGLPIALQIGMEGFMQFLEGAHLADQHFCNAALDKNIPVIMALLSIWYINFFNAHTHAIIPYSDALKHLRAYLQQLDMESNGKSITHSGTEASYSTGAIIWGELGIHGQHAFHQLLHQGKHLVPVDFLLVGQAHQDGLTYHHDLLIANALSQARALMYGKNVEEFKQEMLVQDQISEEEMLRLAKHKQIPGNRPSNVLFMDRLSPKNLGMLLAFYEHKVFVQSVIWNVNPFDQWGVELGKTIFSSVLNDIQNIQSHAHDSSTENLIGYYKNLRV
ncbi:MAG TPA: glucose-6-phosphate isomerase, partial [Gammaproteobacteria bacterium]|nr:glucose-6-phosphate isomerase [Gammaproteobacteria bacterium]